MKITTAIQCEVFCFLEIGLLELCNISDLRFEIQPTVQIYTIKRNSKFSVCKVYSLKKNVTGIRLFDMHPKLLLLF